MEGDLLKTFDTLPILESEKINDVSDQIPMTHAAGTVEQGDVGLTPNILQSCTILKCNSDAKSASKVCEYVGGMPLTGSIEQCAGRTVLVIFTNGNDVENPQINYKNASGPIILINQASNVTVGKGCWTAGSRQLFTIDGSAWVMHSNVAQQTSEYTILADSTYAYSKNKIDTTFVKGSGVKIQRVSRYFKNEIGEVTITLPENFSDNNYAIIITYKYISGAPNISLKSGNYYQKGLNSFLINIESYNEMDVLFTCIGI